MLEAQDQLRSAYDLRGDAVATLERDGHCLLRGLLTAEELSVWRSALVDAVSRHDQQTHSMEQAVGGADNGWVFVDNVWRLDEAARAFILARRFGKLAADLLGVDCVRLFRDQSYFKAPGGANTSWHQDAHFMPLDTDRIITLWVTLSDVSEDMAPLRFVSGSHRAGPLGASLPDDASMDAFENRLKAKGYAVKSYGALAAGDATFHLGWTLHSSRANTSARRREAFVIVYYADGARMAAPPVLGPDAAPVEHFAAHIRTQNARHCLPGLKPGDLAATDRNPVVFRRKTVADGPRPVAAQA